MVRGSASLGHFEIPTLPRTRYVSNLVPAFGRLFANPHRDWRQSTARPTIEARSGVREAARSRSKTAIPSVYSTRSQSAETCTMALRGRRSGMAVLDGLGGPSYKTSVCDRVQYKLRDEGVKRGWKRKLPIDLPGQATYCGNSPLDRREALCPSQSGGVIPFH